MKFVLGILFGIFIVAAGAFLYLKFGALPVAVADKAFAGEAAIVHVPLDARIDKEAPKSAPIAADDGAFIAGAQIYREQCAFCHGVKGHDSAVGAHMYPSAPQLWKAHRAGVVGVSDDPPGETYWKVANGIRLTAMPAYAKILDETQMWQVSLLLANADKPMPAATDNLLKQPLLLQAQESGAAVSPRAFEVSPAPSAASR